MCLFVRRDYHLYTSLAWTGNRIYTKSQNCIVRRTFVHFQLGVINTRYKYSNAIAFTEIKYSSAIQIHIDIFTTIFQDIFTIESMDKEKIRETFTMK